MAFNDGRVISNLIIQALKNKPLTIYGDGSQTRSFCYVEDLINGTISFMNQDKLLGPLNLGNPAELSILDLAERIIITTNSKSTIEYKDLPEDDPLQRQPDISLAKQLKWEPTINLEQGLKKTINYFENRMKRLE